MSRVKVKSVKKTLGNKDVQSLFQQAMGTDADGPLPLQVVWPKFKRVRHEVARALKAASWLTTCEWMAVYFPDELAGVHAYFKRLREEFAEVFQTVPDLDVAMDPLAKRMASADPDIAISVVPDFDKVPAADLEAFTAAYRPAMQSDLVNTVIVTCNNLSLHKKALENKDDLRPRFLRGPGLSFEPFPELAAANFKAFYNHPDVTPQDRENILFYLHKLYHVTHGVYEAVSQPDIDVEEFVEVVTASIDQVQKQFGKECRDAFRKLKESVQLMRENFGTYIRDVQESGNANLMMENFVLDVAGNSGDVKPHVRAQFAKIIGFYRKQAKLATRHDQKAQALFSELDKNLKELDRHDRRGAEGAAAEDEEEDEEDGEAVAAAAAAPPGDELDELFASVSSAMQRESRERERAAMEATTKIVSHADLGAEPSRPSQLLMELRSLSAAAGGRTQSAAPRAGGAESAESAGGAGGAESAESAGGDGGAESAESAGGAGGAESAGNAGNAGGAEA